jgi:hypothetical protein
MSSSSYNSNYLDDEELAALAVITANTMAVIAVVQQRGGRYETRKKQLHSQQQRTSQV